MSLYKPSDSVVFLEKLDGIMKKTNDIISKTLRPTTEDLWKIIYTVYDFVKERKRKIYGGFALSKLIEDVSPDDKLYSDDDIKSWDIDFYSPDPINDAKEITNRLHKKGFSYISAGEAQHDETYKIYVETKDCADITYVPSNIYNKIPYKEIKGAIITGQHFMMIDYFRAISDPLSSYHRLEKTFTRLCLMLKHFPLPKNTTKLVITPPNRDLDVAFHTIHTFLTNRKSTIVVGMYAYNYLIKESKIADKSNMLRRHTGKPGNKRNNTSHDIDYVDINYYEIISTDYTNDARALILALQEKYPTSKKKIVYRENYPFFQYFGYSVDIYFDNELICQLYNYNFKCTPYNDVPSLYFKKAAYTEEKGVIRLGSFAVQMMYNLINIMKARTNNDLNKKNLYYVMISHITIMKNYYLDNEKKTIFDKSLFEEFILTCAGETNSAQMERAIKIDKKIIAGKKLSWRYNPANPRDVSNNSKYVFKNSSGNPINNDKNKHINLTSIENKIINEYDEAYDPDVDDNNNSKERDPGDDDINSKDIE